MTDRIAPSNLNLPSPSAAAASASASSSSSSSSTSSPLLPPTSIRTPSMSSLKTTTSARPPEATTTTAARKEKPSTLRSLIAGSTAGAIEIGITYPFEFAKTRLQLAQRSGGSTKGALPPFGREWYAGCTTLIVGNSVKAGIRFVAFDSYKQLLADPETGETTGARVVLAGLGAGITESLVAVTPFESIKTQLVDDRKSASPRMRGFLHGSALIAREKGIRGFFQGFVPTTARQGANSAIRFSSYTAIRQFAQGYLEPGEKFGMASTFAQGAAAGIITVYSTQPLDVVKTRMQSIEARTQYTGVVNCAARVFREEGLRAFWAGALPRLGRLSMSGGIVFLFYEKSIELLNALDPQKKFL